MLAAIWVLMDGAFQLQHIKLFRKGVGGLICRYTRVNTERVHCLWSLISLFVAGIAIDMVYIYAVAVGGYPMAAGLCTACG